MQQLKPAPEISVDQIASLTTLRRSEASSLGVPPGLRAMLTSLRPEGIPQWRWTTEVILAGLKAKGLL
jgi:hypothetical protein